MNINNKTLNCLKNSKKIGTDADYMVVMAEKDISWQLQNQIHYAMNTAYDGISQSFIAKTYADVRPSMRVLRIKDNQLIGHIAIVDDTLNIDGESYSTACLGLWFSLFSNGAGTVINCALNYLRDNTNFDFALGRTNHEKLLTEVLPNFDVRVLNCKLNGKNKSSKNSDKVILLNLKLTTDELDGISTKTQNASQLAVATEPF